MSSKRMDDIEALSERLGFLQTTNKASEKYRQSDIEMLTVPVPAPMTNNKQATMLKNIVPDSGWFDVDRIKFEDW